MPNYNVDLGPDVTGILESGNFIYPFSSTTETRKILNLYFESLNSILFGIDGSKFTSNIKVIDTTSFNLTNKVELFDSGTDGLILTGLNDISRETLMGKSRIGAILGVADCASIIGSTKDGGSIFNIHAGYKGVFGNGEGGMLGGILYNLTNMLTNNNIKLSDINQIHISPMAGKNYELPHDYIYELSNDFFQTFGFTDYHKYFSDKVHLNSDGLISRYMDLRQIIIDALLMFGFERNQITDSGINTTDKDNNWASNRKQSNGFQKKGYRLSSTIYKDVK